MRVSHAAAGRDAVFDDPNLVSCGGLAAAAHQWGANELDRSKTTLAGQPRGEGAPRVSCPPKTPGRQVRTQLTGRPAGSGSCGRGRGRRVAVAIVASSDSQAAP